MKLYLGYRSAYFPNSRYLKEFEEESVLSWFQRHWETFTKEESEEYLDILGADIYGFPIWQIYENEPVPNKPESFEELKRIVEIYFYNSEVKGNNECLQVFTDDDEIELTWFLFTEKYKNENWEKLCIWFQKDIPTRYGIMGKEYKTGKTITPIKKDRGSTYFISCPIYDGANLSDLEGNYQIKGVRLPGLIKYLQTEDIGCINNIEYNHYGFDELLFIQYLSRKIQNPSLKGILEISSQVPLTDLDMINFEELSIQELLNLELGNEPEKSIVKISDHYCEISINSLGEFYNYWLFFDDLWIEKNEELAKSLIRFGNTWRI